MMKTHDLKTWPRYYEEIWAGRKNFELRKNDRDFKVGDILFLLEFDPEQGYTGARMNKIVTYILEGGQFGLEEGYVIMSLEDIP